MNPTSTEAEALASTTALASRRMVLCEGERISYQLLEPAQPAQPGPPPPWLLLHGAGHESGVWRPLAELLVAAGAPVYLVDLPAHGHSEGVARSTIEDFAAWALALLDALALERVQLGGHSMGSLIALALAAQSAQRCVRLVLLGSSVPMPVAPFLLETLATTPERAFELINKFSFASPAKLDEGDGGVAGGQQRQLLADNLARMRALGAAVLSCDLQACNSWQGGAAAAAALRAPVLLLSGGQDRMTPPAAAEALAALLAARHIPCRHLSLSDCGHSMMLEQPAAVAAAMAGRAELDSCDTSAIQC